MVIDDRRKKYTCYVCLAKFSTNVELSIHRATHASSSDAEDDCFEEEFVPNSKSESLDTVNDLKDVSANNGTLNKYQTDEPKKLEPKKVEKQEIEPKIFTSFKCDTCNVFFQGSDDAKRHKSSVKCKFACRLCNRKFNTLYAFVVHVMQHKSNAVQNQQRPSKASYFCQLCNKSFDDCFQLKRHEIQFHKKKLTDFQKINTTLNQKDKTESKSNVDEKYVVTETAVNPIEISHGQNTVGDVSFTCELCYDIFTESSELDKHMEFHKQLEKISEQIILDDDDEFVEVVEDNSDKHDIKTTIRATKRSSDQMNTSVKPLKRNLTLASLPNKQLTDKIKEMLTPNSEKVSKTIFLASPLVNTTQKKKLQNIAAKPQVSHLHQTGPLSFSINYKDNNSLNLVTPQTQSQITSSNTSLILNTAISEPSTGFSLNSLPNSEKLSTSSVMNEQKSVASIVTPTTQYAYFIIPHNNITSTVVLPTSNISVNQNYNKNIGVQKNDNNLQKQNTSTISSDFSSSLLSNHVSESIVNSTNVGVNSSVIDLCSNLNISYSTTNNLSSSSSDFPSNISKQLPPTTDVPEIVILDSDDDEMNSENLSQKQTNDDVASAKETQNNESFSKENTTEDVDYQKEIASNIEETMSSHVAPVISIEQCDNKNDDLSDSEAAENLIIDEREEDETSKNDDGRVINDECHLNNSKKEVFTAGQKGFISVKKLEDLIEPKINESNTISNKNKVDANVSGKRSEPSKKKKKQKFPVRCDTCAVVICRPKTFREHNKRKRSCKHCDYKCCRYIDLRVHYFEVHTLYFCWQCDFLSDSNEAFKEHRKIHSCTMCDGVYSNLSAHVCKKNKLKYRNFENKESLDGIETAHAVEQGLISIKNRKNLIDGHASSTDKDFINVDKQRGDKGHIITEDARFKKQCDDCSLVFNKSRNFRLHKKRKSFCSSCDFKTCSVGDMKDHYLEKHNLYLCFRCKFVSESKEMHKEHRQQHYCTMCRGFFSDLSKHVCKTVKLIEDSQKIGSVSTDNLEHIF